MWVCVCMCVSVCVGRGVCMWVSKEGAHSCNNLYYGFGFLVCLVVVLGLLCVGFFGGGWSYFLVQSVCCLLSTEMLLTLL